MSANRTIFNGLIANGLIEVDQSPIFEQVPDQLNNLNFGKIEGMMLGLAIGDSLGNTSESMSPRMRFQRYGEIRDYLPHRYAGNRAVGLPSDDTQLTFWTLEQMIADRCMNPEHIAHRFTGQRIFGIGKTMKEFLKKYKQGVPWYKAGIKSAGNGALMRIAPAILPYLNTPSADLWVDTALLTTITHNDTAAISTSIAYVALLLKLLQRTSPPEPLWYLEQFLQVSSDLELGHEYKPRTPNIKKYRQQFSDYCRLLLIEAWEKNCSVMDACNYWYSGAYLLETIPSTLYILMKCGHDPEQAIIRAVNDTWDNDTVAALVGAAMGALYGKQALPERWINNLTGRTGEKDDGRIPSLLRHAKEMFWENLF